MSRNQGITADPLFVGMTRPSMVWGVTYSAMMFNIVVTTEAFIVTKSLAWLLAFVPIHGVLSTWSACTSPASSTCCSSGAARACRPCSAAICGSGVRTRTAPSRWTCLTGGGIAACECRL